MKKIALITIILLLSITLFSCKAFNATVSGDIINPVNGFSRGNDDDTLVLGENKYILIDEIGGNFEFDITDDDVFLGETSNFPFFPNFSYYANENINAEYIASGSSSNKIATVVFLREDLYQAPICYVLQDTDFEFVFSDAFIETKEVSYKTHVERKKYSDTAIINFYIKEYPRLTASMWIYKIDDKWYSIKPNEAFALSENFVKELIK